MRRSGALGQLPWWRAASALRLLSLFWCNEGAESVSEMTKLNTSTSHPPQPINRKQELDKNDKNTILFVAVASTIQAAEGHALDRKCDCFWKERWLSWGGACGKMVGRKGSHSGLLGWGLCPLLSLAGEEIEPDLLVPLLATASGSTLNIQVSIPLLPGTCRHFCESKMMVGFHAHCWP